MNRVIMKIASAVVVFTLAGGALAFGQSSFKIPFGFIAGGKKLPAGDYIFVLKGSDQISLKKGPDGTEILVTFTGRLEVPATPPVEPQLIFDMVGNFEPSYSEYITDHVLAELWLPGEKGYLVRAMKGAHQHKTVTGQKAGK